MQALTAARLDRSNRSKCDKVAFKEVIALVGDARQLHLLDFTFPFRITTDGSGVCIGGFLSQIVNGEEKICAYASRPLNVHEKCFLRQKSR